MRRLVLSLMLLLSAATSGIAAPSLPGTWFGTGEPYDAGAMYIDHFQPGGHIHSDFRSCVKGKPLDGREDGTWSLKGDRLVISVISHNGVFMPRNDPYRILSLSADACHYVYLPTKFPFSARRVDAKFAMPDCQLVS